MAIEFEKIKSWDGQSGTGADNRGVIDRNFEKVKTELDGNKAEIVQLAGDVEQLAGEAVKKGSAVGTINLLQLDPSVWESGAIASSTGLDTISNTRLRTIDYFPIESNHDYNVNIQSDHKIVILLYGLNREYIGTAVSATWITSNLSFKTPNNAVYYRVVMSKADDSELNVGELANVRIKLATGLMPTDFSEAPEDVNRRMDYATLPIIWKDIYTSNFSIHSITGGVSPNSARLSSGYIMNLKGISNVPEDYYFTFRYYNENLDFEGGDSFWREGSGMTSDFPFARIMFSLKSEEDFNAQNTEYLLNSINIRADDKYLSDEIINFAGFGSTAAQAGAFNNLDIYFNPTFNELRQIVNGTTRTLPLSETVFYQGNGQLLSFSLEKGFLLQGKPMIFTYKGLINALGIINTSVAHEATDYIEINDNPIYFNLIAHQSANVVSFYDESKEYLSGVKGLTPDSNDLKIYHYKKDGIIPPVLAKYARFSRYNSVFLFNQGVGDGNYIYQKDNKYLNNEIPAIPTSQSDSDLRDDIPENIGVYNTVRKAKQMTDIQFTPKNPIQYNTGTYNAGTTYTGLIYSSTKEINTYIGRNVSFHTFMTAINNPRSLIYTEKINEPPYHGVNSRAYYGTVCSTFVAYCWGIDVDYRTYDFVLADFTEEVKDQSAYGLKLGDGIWNPGHIIIVTGIRRTNKGLIERIELCESISPRCRKFYINSTEEFDSWMKTSGGRIIYRNTELYSNRGYTPETDFVAVEDEAITPFAYNDLICCNKGDKANYRVGEKVILNIAEGYSNLEIYKDDVLLNTVALTDIVDIEVSDLSYGSYKARITRAGEESDFTYWEVVDTTVTLDKVNNRVYFNSLNSTPQYFEFCDISGFRPEDYSKIDTHTFTEEEISQGYIEVDVPSNVPDSKGRLYIYAKVHFKNSYGVIINKPINWYE